MLVILVVAVAIPTVIGVARVLNTQPPSDADLAYAEEQVAAESDRPGVQRRYQRCLDNPERFLGQPLPDDVEAACDRELPAAARVVRLLGAAGSRRRPGQRFRARGRDRAGDPDDAGGHDLRRPRLGQRVREQPAPVRAAPSARVGRQGGRSSRAVAGLFAAVVVTAYWLFLGAVANSRDIPIGDGLLLDCLQSGWRGAAVAAVPRSRVTHSRCSSGSTVAALGVLLAASVAGGIVLAVIGVDSVLEAGHSTSPRSSSTGRSTTPTSPAPVVGSRQRPARSRRRCRSVAPCGSSERRLVLFAAASLASFQRRDVP